MAIERIPYGEALAVSMQDYVRQNNLLETGFLRVNDPWPIVGGNIVKGAVFQIGGTVYLATSNTAIGGAASNYVKLTPSGDGSTCAADYVANLAGVSWNDTYNGYYDVGGNLYIFDETLAIINAEIAIAYTKSGYLMNLYAQQRKTIYRDSAGVETFTRTAPKIIEIGDWNMDTTNLIQVAHGLADWTKIHIRAIKIIADVHYGGGHYPINIYIGGMSSGYWYMDDADHITLIRANGGFYDSINFDSISYNRGLIYIDYEI
jgi:hypothetical protein